MLVCPALCSGELIHLLCSISIHPSWKELMYDTSDFRKGLKLDIDGVVYAIIECQFVKPGKGQGFSRTRLKNLATGAVIDRTFKSSEKVAKARLEVEF